MYICACDEHSIATQITERSHSQVSFYTVNSLSNGWHNECLLPWLPDLRPANEGPWWPLIPFSSPLLFLAASGFCSKTDWSTPVTPLTPWHPSGSFRALQEAALTNYDHLPLWLCHVCLRLKPSLFSADLKCRTEHLFNFLFVARTMLETGTEPYTTFTGIHP